MAASMAAHVHSFRTLLVALTCGLAVVACGGPNAPDDEFPDYFGPESQQAWSDIEFVVGNFRIAGLMVVLSEFDGPNPSPGPFVAEACVPFDEFARSLAELERQKIRQI